MKKKFVILNIFILILMSKLVLASQNPVNLEKELITIESYYWFGLEEKGNNEVFLKALNKINLLEKKIKKKEHSEKILFKLQGLKEDIKQQLDMSKDTFYGVFPLSRFFSNNFFSDATAFGTYELFDDYEVMSSNNAIENLISTLEDKEKKQLDVVFTSKPHNYALENEALYLFNKKSQFFVHNQRELNEAFINNKLNQSDIEDFKSGKLNKDYLNALFTYFNTKDLLIISIEKNYSYTNDAFYIVKGSYFKPNLLKPLKIYRNMGFSRDRTYLLNTIMLINLSFFVLSLIIGLYIYSRKPNYNPNLNKNILLILSLSFLISKLSPFFIIPSINSFISVPLPENLALLSFWYLILISIIFLFFPFIVIHILRLKFKSSDFFQLILNNCGIIGIVFSLSIISWFITAFIIFEGSINKIFIFILPSIALCLNFYIMGRAIDKLKLNIKIFCSIILSLSFFISIIALKFNYLYLITFFLFINFLYYKRFFLNIKTPEKIISYSNQKTFWKHPYSNSLDLSEISVNNGIDFTFLKTEDETSAKLCVKQTFTEDVLFIEIECNNENTPFDIINQLLDKKLESKNNDTIEQTVDIISNFIPFNSLINMASSSSGNETSITHILEAASNEFFEKFKNEKNTCIMISGLNYLDQSSNKWLTQIKTSNYKGNINFVLIGKNLPRNLEVHKTIELKDLLKIDLIEYAKNELKTDHELAKKIIDYLDNTDDQTTINDVLFVFQNLKINKFINYDKKWYLHNNIDFEENIFNSKITSIQESINESISNFPEYKDFLIIATCLGYQFNMKVVSNVLNISLIETAKIIEEISIKTGIIENIPNESNKIKFRNRDTLIALNNIFLLNEKLDKIPLIQRTFCYSAAISLKKYKNEFNNEIERIFNLLEKSGANYTEEIILSGLELISNLCILSLFEKANIIINKCLNYIKNYNSFKKESLLNKIIIERHYINLEQLFYEGNSKPKDFKYDFLDDWLEFDNSKNKLIYPIMRTLYNFREYDKLNSFIKNVEKKTDLPKWLYNDINHYKALLQIYYYNDKNKGKDILLKCINDLNNDYDSDTKGVKARIYTSYGNIFPDDIKSKELIYESILIKTQLSDKPGLARSYGSLTRLLVSNKLFSDETLTNANNWLKINLEIKDVFGSIMSRNLLGQVHFNIYKNDNIKKSDLEVSKNFFEDNINMLDNKLDEGSQLQVFTSYADLLEITKYERDQNTYNKLSLKLFALLKEFGEIKNDFFKDKFQKAFVSEFKNIKVAKNEVDKLLN